MSKSPFEEIPVTNLNENKSALASYNRLKTALDKLNPAGGILDDGEGNGRHANKNKAKKQ